jgi:hypothetical protein
MKITINWFYLSLPFIFIVTLGMSIVVEDACAMSEASSLVTPSVTFPDQSLGRELDHIIYKKTNLFSQLPLEIRCVIRKYCMRYRDLREILNGPALSEYVVRDYLHDYPHTLTDYYWNFEPLFIDRSIDSVCIDIIKGHNEGALKVLSACNVFQSIFQSQRGHLLWHACNSGNKTALELLCNAGYSVNESSYLEYFEKPLHAAAGQNRVEILELLIEKGADIENRDTWGKTPLYTAVCMGHINVVRELLVRGADCECKRKTGETALLEANKLGHVEIARLLQSRIDEIRRKRSAESVELESLGPKKTRNANID